MAKRGRAHTSSNLPAAYSTPPQPARSFKKQKRLSASSFSSLTPTSPANDMKENKGTSMMDVDIDDGHHTPVSVPGPNANAKRTSEGAEGEGDADADADEWTKVEKRKAKKAKKAELRLEVRPLPPSHLSSYTPDLNITPLQTNFYKCYGYVATP